MDQTRWATPRPLPQREMREKPGNRTSLFSNRSVGPRPKSVHTEFMGTDWEMEEDSEVSEIDSDGHSDIEDDVECGLEDGESSPRISVGSSGQPSFTTLSSYDEVQTPRSAIFRGAHYPFESGPKPVEGPRGPHLFHNSITSAQSIELQHALSLSPITPKDPRQMDTQLQGFHRTPLPGRRASGPFQFSDAELVTQNLADWTPEMVAQWMLNAGVEIPACERFLENDINGAILITLKFQDLKELGISSFGVRTRIWEEIHVMRDLQQPEPQPETPIEDEPDRRARREFQGQNGSADKPKRQPSKPRAKFNDIISPLESVSIVGIEQMMPKVHNCKKGESCPKWKRNQRMLEAFKKDHPFINVEAGGVIMVAGNPGNPETAPAIDPNMHEHYFRPSSDAIPSFVASSDVMGPGSLPPAQYLQEAMLQAVQQRDPQDNVRNFLDFQSQITSANGEIPPTPPFEILPRDVQQRAANNGSSMGLRGLPKLSIPSQAPSPLSAAHQLPASAHPGSSVPLSAHPLAARPHSQTIPSFREMSPTTSEEGTPTAPYRFGTPASMMDMPVTITELPPLSREITQSVPPDMNYRQQVQGPPRSLSRATTRRPSFPVLPALDENRIVTPITLKPSRTFPMRSASVKQPTPALTTPTQKAPPRVHYPWTSAEHPTMERAIPPMTAVNIGGRLSPVNTGPVEDMTGGDQLSYQGLMKKRKTKMLRHEWHEHFFTLRGTRLAMHKDAETASNKTLEYIDIDDYAIACSSAANSKLNSAFKAMHIRRGSDDKAAKGDVAAFSFQLIPQDTKGATKLKKRESTLGSFLGSSSSSVASTSTVDGAANGTGKTHHFAVKNRDERIDWMRELMLAKALKQKGEGFEVSVNGNMI
ncbi:hypothetical protein B0T16DRAFT_42789 [Cercophora newfieldiana]|uniref:Uncharacterized protein n=1 Tax=Cercophora newfieldiana TaxID=92897 RepID=A0AA40CYW0_9PEZI|nr:hypothetical protein B0T16DRAFT_42789 [Cercophora newfieldiana]